MRTSALGPLVLSVLLLGTGCDNGADPGPAPGTSGVLTARVDGDAWTATANVVAVRTGDFVGVSGLGPGTTNLAFATPAAEGTYVLGAGGPSNASFSQLGPESATWVANVGRGSGSITVTAISGTWFAGTFAFTAEGTSAAAGGTREVTDGRFDVGF